MGLRSRIEKIVVGVVGQAGGGIASAMNNSQTNAMQQSIAQVVNKGTNGEVTVVFADDTIGIARAGTKSIDIGDTVTVVGGVCL